VFLIFFIQITFQSISTSLQYSFPGNGFRIQELLNVSLNHTLPISLYYSTHKVFKSRYSQYHCTTVYIKSSNHTLSLLLYSSSLLLVCLLLPLTIHSSSLLLQIQNSAHLCRCSMDLHHRKHLSRDCYPASPLACWLDLQKTHHVIAKHCCCDATTRVQATRTQIKHHSSTVCCGQHLAMDLHVTIFSKEKCRTLIKLL
jgi:hypothetical protein